jgi:hypothetical protein
VLINRFHDQLAALDLAERAAVQLMLAELVSECNEARWCDFGVALASQDA